ncbi:TIGR03086 family metal-binding protein [Streptomyces sp. A1499]|uniref:TIGR03086 family metal-binding protein n=1 Tax=Streptomyces sp. A1499 TaxID=2563104 RepID=UPI00109ECE2B|nr:TIGR03086 family metal-binding protein [Streptomyces sp. A1499]THC53420.1 TIGR03086 family protein [Streptomyces sp. A1499]
MDISDSGGAAALSISDLLALAAGRAVPVVRALPDDRLADPTPCAEYDVRSLVDHLFHVVVQFQELAAKRDADFSVTPAYVTEGGDWRDRFAAEADRLVAAWAVPGADRGTTGAMDMPAETVGCMALLDLSVHAWDLATATGQSFEAGDDAVVRRLTAAVEELGPTARAMGVFADPGPVPAGATAFERLLAATGRDPRWGR